MRPLSRLLLVLPLSLCLATSVFAGAADNLFGDPLEHHQVNKSQNLTPPEYGRSRLVQVVPGVLGSSRTPAGSFRLNLFDDTEFTAVLEQASETDNGFAWTGRLEGIALSQVVIVDNGGIIMGSISFPGGNYAIVHRQDGLQRVAELNLERFPQELEPLETPGFFAPDSYNSFEMAGEDTCTQISVLVAYTPEARAAAGGTAAMEALIDLAVAETNASYANSGLAQRIHLAHAMETVAGEAANNFSADLQALQDTGDNIFNSVDAAREAHYADLVALIIENNSSCGLGYVNSSAAYAFSVTHRTCATGYYSFGHELGHNMGARHDWYMDDSASLNNDYAKAYLNPTDRWRTVMAYNNYCSDYGTGCTRIPYWSNPNRTYGNPADPMGVAIGTASNCVENTNEPDPLSCDADNRSKLNLTCSAVANFRNSPDGDLIVVAPSVDTANLFVNENFTLSATVENQGVGPAEATTLRYYLSADASITTDDAQQGSDAVAALAASQTSEQSILLAAPATAGTYYFGACVEEAAGESDTTNNCSAGVAVSVSGVPDLVVQDLHVDDATLSTSQNYMLSATVYNQGTAEAEDATLRYYLSPDAAITTTDQELGSDTTGMLAPAGQSVQSIAGAAPASPGNYYLGACVDGVAGESNTGNNCSSGLPIAVSSPGAPDLVVHSPQLDNPQPGKKEAYTLSVTVENGGSGEAGASMLRYYISEDSQITSQDQLIGSDSVPVLAAAAQSEQELTAQAPETEGYYYLGACIETVAGETSTANNCSAATEMKVAHFPWNLFLPAIFSR